MKREKRQNEVTGEALRGAVEYLEEIGEEIYRDGRGTMKRHKWQNEEEEEVRYCKETEEAL
jgi:hypothetical protein